MDNNSEKYNMSDIFVQNMNIYYTNQITCYMYRYIEIEGLKNS